MNPQTAVNNSDAGSAPSEKPKREPLTPQQHRAIGLLSLGADMSETATSCNITRQTLSRWKRNPEFQRALTRQIGEMMNGVVEQVQNEARVLIEGGLDAANKLRSIVLRETTPVGVCRHACNDILRHQGRFLDLLGYNANLALRRKLAVQELDELQDAEENPDDLPPPHPSDINNIAAKKESELTPANPFNFHHTPPAAFIFRDNPINEDGTLATDGDQETLRSPGVPPGPNSTDGDRLSGASAEDRGTENNPAASGEAARPSPPLEKEESGGSTPTPKTFLNHAPECYYWLGHDCNMACDPRPVAPPLEDKSPEAKLRAAIAAGRAASQKKEPWPNKCTRPQWQPPESVQPRCRTCPNNCTGACTKSCDATASEHKASDASSDNTACDSQSAPTGLCNKAQGCAAGATLGLNSDGDPNPEGVAYPAEGHGPDETAPPEKQTDKG
jgi:hypothetical protein